MYDSMTPIVDFNVMGGNTCERRELDDPSIDMQRSLINEEVNEELTEAFEKGSLLDILDACGDSIVVIAGLIHKLGFDPNEVMRAVNDSNLSKFCVTEHHAQKSVEAYENHPDYSDVEYTFDSKLGLYVIRGKKKDANGWKILKGINYFQAEERLQKLIDGE